MGGFSSSFAGISPSSKSFAVFGFTAVISTLSVHSMEDLLNETICRPPIKDDATQQRLLYSIYFKN